MYSFGRFTQVISRVIYDSELADTNLSHTDTHPPTHSIRGQNSGLVHGQLVNHGCADICW